MDNKTKNRIINALRAISRSWGPRQSAKAKRKVGPATFACDKCGVYIYEGKSTKAVDEILTKLGKAVIMDRAHLDHNIPVVPLEGWKDFKDFSTNIIERMFCEESNYNLYCPPCHALKTQGETEVRKNHRRKKKAQQKAEETKKENKS